MSKSSSSSNRQAVHRSLRANTRKGIAAMAGVGVVPDVGAPVMPPPNQEAAKIQLTGVALDQDSRPDSHRGQIQAEPQAQNLEEILVDVDTGPEGLGMVFWFQGG